MRAKNVILCLSVGLCGGLFSLHQADAFGLRQSYVEQVGYRFDGGVTSPAKSMSSVSACKAACEASSSCLGYEWNANDGTCRQAVAYGKFVPASGRSINVGVPARNIGEMFAMGKSMWQGFDAPGHDIASYSGVNAESTCRALCAANGECKAYTWRDSDDRCWLKKHVPGFIPRGGLVSGHVPWEDKSGPSKSFVLRNAQIRKGTWLASSKVSKAEAGLRECRQACDDDASCKSAVVSLDTGDCRMFKDFQKDSLVENAHTHANRASIIKLGYSQRRKMDALTGHEMPCHDQVGNDFAHVTTASLKSCQMACAMDSRCRAATWNWDNQTCFMKTSYTVPNKRKCNATTTWQAGYPY